MIDLDILDIGLTTDQKNKLQKYINSLYIEKSNELDLNEELSYESLKDSDEIINTYSFGGLYDNTYIRLEDNDILELIKVLNKLYVK